MNQTTLCSLILLSLVVPGGRFARGEEARRTFCNPINLSYRFQLVEPSRREAADPVVVLYKDDYYLFASKSGGYWYSNDLADWTFVPIKPEVLSIEDYAPAAVVLGDALYYTGSNSEWIYRSRDPKKGTWEKAAKADPSLYPSLDRAFFQDDDGKLYLYYGCSNKNPILGVELDPENDFKSVGQPFFVLTARARDYGWERRGDDNLLDEVPWFEGAWMTKYKGLYYLQYAAPGTEFTTYADGIYTASSPKGPFTYADNSPFSHKPTGFIRGAGHSSTFRDKKGNYWRAVTMVIAVKHKFERRVGFFPATFDQDGLLHSRTLLGDYPQYLPGQSPPGVKSSFEDNLVGWMLLSHGKKAVSSSVLEGHPVTHAFDENAKTYWSARTGEKGEWIRVDLGKTCRVHAMQINFFDHDTEGFGRREKDRHQYTVAISTDDKSWQKIIDKSDNDRDVPHDYVELDAPVMARHIKLTNFKMPAGGTFALSGLRVFGLGLGKAPAAVKNFSVERSREDGRTAVIKWNEATGAEGTIVRYGVAPGKLYNNYEVRGSRTVTINSLNRAVTYYFSLDTFNDSGMTRGTLVQKAPGLETGVKQ